MSLPRRFSNLVANVATFAASLVICYSIGEFAFLRFVAPNLPPYLRAHLPDLPDVRGQSSKYTDLPHDYILLLGDSYAEGLGDWLAAQGRHSQKYSSAHVLHDLTGSDVISLGRWGLGSAEALVLKPARVYLDDDCIPLPSLERPKRIFAYFFEGNDLHDNFRWITRRVPRARDGNVRAAVAGYLEQTYGVIEWWRCHTYFALTARETFKLLYRDWVHQKGSAPLALQPIGGEAANRIWSAGAAVPAGRLYPPLWHPEDRDGAISFVVFDEALAWLRQHFPAAAVTVVYLPSPAAVYRYAAPLVTAPEPAESAATVYSDSQKICDRIRTLSLGRGAGFIDTRPIMRAAADQTLLHGPRDWIHLNEAGYRVLAATLAQANWNNAESP
jgi:hypothetical protein